MATPDRDTIYTSDGTTRVDRTVYTRDSNATGWFVGIIVALALLAIGYLVFSANSGPNPSTTVDVNNTPAVTVPPADTMAPAPATEPAPMVEAPAANPAPATTPAPAASPADTTPTETPAPAPAVPATGG